MRVLVLGGDGMLGHKLAQVLSKQFEVFVTTRVARDALRCHPLFTQFSGNRTIGLVDALNSDSLIRAMSAARPSVVVNAVGIVKQLAEAQNALLSIEVNALFPHRMAALCQATGARFIHISTDCVFSGKKGSYTEADPPDAEDLYGRTKSLGEVSEPGSLTLRTSIIGRDFNRRTGLLEWFLSQSGQVPGYKNVIYSGVTTQTLAGIISAVISDHVGLSGIYQVAGETIAKYDLLCRIREAFRRPVEIVPTEDPRCDRSMEATKFTTETGMKLPTWDEMIRELAVDETPYEACWRARDSVLRARAPYREE